MRIVVADDEPDLLEFYRGALARLGHTVVAAAKTGNELIEQCRSTCPDLIVTDIKMPELDGIEAAARIYRAAPIAVIVVSGCHDAEYITRAQQNHVLAYLVKPVVETQLAAAIAIAITRFEEFQALRQEAADLRQTSQNGKSSNEPKASS